jgi:dTDP-4-dehydrorhamnose reductase
VAPEFGVDALGRTWAELDVTDGDAVARVLDELQPGVVLNCAAVTNVDLCEERAEEAHHTNAEGPAVLAKAGGDQVVLVHISTEYVFSGDRNRPLSEDVPPGPISVYGKSKLAGEEKVREMSAEHLIIRTQWLFGPGPNFVRTILAAARRREELRVVEDQLGRPTWSGELARGLFQAVQEGARGTLHLACEGLASWYDLAVAAVEEATRRGLAPSVQVRPVSTVEMPRPARRPAYAVLALERARGMGINLLHWRDALAAYLDAEAEGRDA